VVTVALAIVGSASGTEAAACSPNFPFDEIKECIAKEPVRFRVAVQLAEDGDPADDATHPLARWASGAGVWRNQLVGDRRG
jgi:hypothetical protein